MGVGAVALAAGAGSAAGLVGAAGAPTTTAVVQAAGDGCTTTDCGANHNQVLA